MKLIIFIICFEKVLLHTTATLNYDTPLHGQLAQDLMANDTKERPARNYYTTVNVYATFRLLQIIDVVSIGYQAV